LGFGRKKQIKIHFAFTDTNIIYNMYNYNTLTFNYSIDFMA